MPPEEYVGHRLISVSVQVNGTAWRVQKGCLSIGRPLVKIGSAPALGSGPMNGPALASDTQIRGDGVTGDRAVRRDPDPRDEDGMLPGDVWASEDAGTGAQGMLGQGRDRLCEGPGLKGGYVPGKLGWPWGKGTAERWWWRGTGARPVRGFILSNAELGHMHGLGRTHALPIQPLACSPTGRQGSGRGQKRARAVAAGCAPPPPACPN